jgi:hypothetical protein
MTEKIKEIVDQFLRDHSSWGTYKYRLNSSYWVKFDFTLRTDQIRVYLYSELPGYEFCRSVIYKMGYGPLNDDNEGLAILIEMIYREIEKMNSDGVSIGYDLYKSVLADNDKLREEIKALKKQAEDWHNKYIKEKMDHTSTSARIIFAKHILSGNRDENVIEHMRTYGV